LKCAKLGILGLSQQEIQEVFAHCKRSCKTCGILFTNRTTQPPTSGLNKIKRVDDNIQLQQKDDGFVLDSEDTSKIIFLPVMIGAAMILVLSLILLLSLKKPAHVYTDLSRYRGPSGNKDIGVGSNLLSIGSPGSRKGAFRLKDEDICVNKGIHHVDHDLQETSISIDKEEEIEIINRSMENSNTEHSSYIGLFADVVLGYELNQGKELSFSTLNVDCNNHESSFPSSPQTTKKASFF